MPAPSNASERPEPTIQMTEGWHCLHLFYRVDQQALSKLSTDERLAGRQSLISLLEANGDDAPQRLQASLVSGHKADLALMVMDPDPLKVDQVQQRIRSSDLGSVLVPVWSFVSITEVSEYVPTLEQYTARLTREGQSVDDPAIRAKVAAYERRLPMMNQQRLYPDFPPFPVFCFYPMNKARHPLANWYAEPFSRRSQLMAEHATSGIKFAGRVSQLITASTGFDDWEWGVTLWGASPEDIKEIVYTMRFDEASARYAEFGPFYISYIQPVAEIFKHLHIQ